MTNKSTVLPEYLSADYTWLSCYFWAYILFQFQAIHLPHVATTVLLWYMALEGFRTYNTLVLQFRVIQGKWYCRS